MKLLSAITMVILGTLLESSLSAQTNGCYFKKSFPASKGVKLAVSNKYGDINILTSKTDSMLICATINIEQEDDDLSSKSIRLIEFNVTGSNDSVAVATLYNKDFFNPKYSKGRKSFSVDYTIQVPVYTNLYLNNAFGNISIEDCSGYVDTKLSQGLLIIKNLSRGNAKPINKIDVFHSDVEINKADWLSLSIKNCPSVKITDVQAILAGSEFSKININKVHSMVATSKSDHYEIGKIENLESESTYTTYKITSLDGLMSANCVFGSVSISSLSKYFNSVMLTAIHTPVTIKTEKGISFRTEISASNNSIEFAF
ncbi:MAG TPA: hypothetical protein VJ963_12770, partial [Bacteroidales bacterium]|nr:hypothetical protein [Bacteroidales bacterium]